MQRLVIPGRLDFRSGPAAIDCMELIALGGERLLVSLHGAQVLSWTNKKGEEQLFLSDRATFQTGKAIRGGIPIVFPQFGPGKLPNHGFARTAVWSPIHSALTPDGGIEVRLELCSSPESERVWPFKFRAQILHKLTDKLTTVLRVQNLGISELFYQAAFHTYFKVASLEAVEILGLEGCGYRDNLDNLRERSGDQSRVKIDREIDRIYKATPSIIYIDDLMTKRRITLSKFGMPDAVVWNPWVERSKQMGDLGAEEYLDFVCLEAGAIIEPLCIEAGAERICSQELLITTL
jgi:glucose-6-phosphate 1-epimerase